jgi:hypothetical protein
MMIETILAHPGVYVNAGISIIMTVWVLVSGLIIYIWRTNLKDSKEKTIELEKRIKELEIAKLLALDKLILNPVLTIPIHQIFCGEVWTRFLERVALMEENIGLKITNAVLEAAKNGYKDKQ